MRLFLLTTLSLLLTVGVYAAPPAPKAPYVPQETRVALLPVVSAPSGDGAAISSARVSLGRQFVGHGFKVVAASEVTAALDSLKLTLTPPEPPTAEALTKIGAAVNARLVVFVVVTPAERHADAKVWVWDTKTRAFVVDGKASWGAGAGAVRQAVNVGLAEFFKPYEAYDC